MEGKGRYLLKEGERTYRRCSGGEYMQGWRKEGGRTEAGLEEGGRTYRGRVGGRKYTSIYLLL